MIPGESTIVAIKDQVSCDLAGEAVILSLKDGVYYGLDPVGARIWSMIQEPRTLNQIVDTIIDEYDVERERCQRDLLELLIQFEDKGLIEVLNASGNLAI